MFNEFFQLCVPDRCIHELQVFTSSSPTHRIGSSRLIKLTMSDNIPPFIALLSDVMSSNQIVELHLCRCNRQISFNLPMVTHLTLVDSLDSLNSRSLSTNIRSIQIILHQECRAFTNGDWTALRAVSALPLLKSLRVYLYDMRTPPNHTSAEIISKTALTVANFSLCFRRYDHRYVEFDYDIDLACIKHSIFINRLRNRIASLSRNQKLHMVVDEDAGEIFTWF